jgi:hypothetical protein
MAIFHGFGSSKLRSFFAGTRKEGVAMSYEKLTSMCFFCSPFQDSLCEKLHGMIDLN